MVEVMSFLLKYTLAILEEDPIDGWISHIDQAGMDTETLVRDSIQTLKDKGIHLSVTIHDLTEGFKDGTYVAESDPNPSNRMVIREGERYIGIDFGHTEEELRGLLDQITKCPISCLESPS
jgi:hypothetical protein